MIEHEKHFRLLIQTLIDGVVLIGNDGLIRFTNRAAEQLFQRTSEQLTGSPFGFPVTENRTTEIEIPQSDGKTIPVEMRVVHILWEGDPAYLVSLRDVAERRKAEEERRRYEIERQFSQKLESLGVLAGGIAHDFNNLLMTIVARSGLALRLLPQDAPARDHLAFIEKAGLRGGELANQMLTFAGQTKLNFQNIRLSIVLKDMAPFLRSIISKRIIFKYDFDASLPPIRADQNQLRQIIINLVTNASEAGGDLGGSITVRTFYWKSATEDFRNWYVIGKPPADGAVAFTIQDTGCGMVPDMIPKIFDPFFSTKFPGRGLGLSTLLGIVQAHAGTIAVRSEPEVGTEFMLLFPAAMPAVRTKKPTTLSIPGQQISLSKKPVILVVDDEEDVRVACTLIFQEMGMDTLVAADGHIGLQVFQQHQKDILAVLLDLTMPNMDGRQFMNHLRNLNATIPVILSSGYTEEEAMKRFHHSGVAAFIQKPYQVEVLIDKIQELRETSQYKPSQ